MQTKPFLQLNSRTWLGKLTNKTQNRNEGAGRDEETPKNQNLSPT